MAGDGSQVAWFEARESGDFFVPTLVLTGTDRGDELLAMPLPEELLGSFTGFDPGDSSMFISRTVPEGPWLPALIVDTEDGSILELAVAGEALWESGT